MFEPFPKISRLNRNVVITEKIDGTNAQVFIFPANEVGAEGLSPDDPMAIFQDKFSLSFKGGYGIAAGSRSTFLTLDRDNFGFAAWVKDNANSLFDLGCGRHFGEWWGKGIQRGYGLSSRTFSLFNTSRWADNRPKCCEVVPVLHKASSLCSPEVGQVLQELRDLGSRAAPGFMKPEGIVLFHEASNHLYKVTLEKDNDGKTHTSSRS